MATKFFKEEAHWVYQKDADPLEHIVTPGFYVLSQRGSIITIQGVDKSIDVLFKNVEVSLIEKDRSNNTYTDLADFITLNEAFFGGIFGTNTKVIAGSVGTYAELPTPTTSYIGELWYVEAPSGGLLTVLNIYKYPKGLYSPNSSDIWEQVSLNVKVAEDAVTLINVPVWSDYFNYSQDINVGDRLIYNRIIYENITGNQISTTPNLDTLNWRTVDANNRVIPDFDYFPEKTVRANTLVFDYPFTMISKVDTSERAAPQPIGSIQLSAPDESLYLEGSNISIVAVNHRFIMKETGWIKTLDLLTPIYDSDTYTKVTIINHTTGKITTKSNFILKGGEFTNIATEDIIVTIGTDIEIIFETFNASNADNITGGWKSDRGSGIPTSQEFNIDNLNDPTVISISTIDLDNTDRTTELSGVLPDSIFLASETSDPTRSVEVKILTTTPQTGYVDYTCELITVGGKGSIRADKTCTLNINVPITQPTKYNYIDDYYDTQPVFADVTTKLSFNGVDQVASITTVYGIQVTFQRASISEDWKTFAISDVSGTVSNAVTGIEHSLSVAKSGGDFTSLKAAVDSIVNPSATNLWGIRCYSGTFVEDPMIIPDYVKVVCNNAKFVPNDNNSDFITLATEAEMKSCHITPPTNGKGIVLQGVNSRLKDSTVDGPCLVSIETQNVGTLIRDVDVLFSTIGFNIFSGDCLIAQSAAIACGIGLQVDDGAYLLGSGLANLSCTLDLVTLGSGSIEITSSKLQIAKFNIANWDNIKVSSNSDKEGDEAVVNMQEFQVGVPERGYESAFGEGDSYTRGMKVYTYDGTTFIDISEAAASASGSLFSFPNVNVNSALYLASTLHNDTDFIKHFGIKSKTVTALVGGEVVFEYWNGTIWVEFNAMEVGSGGHYTPHAKNYFQHASSHHIRYDVSLSIGDWAKSDPVVLGTDYFWVRIRIKTTLTTLPQIEQFKLHTNRTELNADGYLEYFGLARGIERLPWDAGLLQAANSSPGNQDLYISDNLGVGRIENKFVNNAVDRLSFLTPLPLTIDTSCKINFAWSVRTDDNTLGDIDWTIRWAWSSDGESVYGSTGAAPGTAPNEQSIVQSLPAPALNTEKWYKVELDVSNMLSEREGGFPDTLWVSLERDGADTHEGDVSLIAINALYKKWREGGHI